MGGIVGRLFREFAVTLSIAVALSALVSLTLTPMMCSRLLKTRARAATGASTTDGGGSSTAILRFYDRGLRWVLRHQADHARSSRSSPIALTVGLFMIVPKGLFPQQDTGR